jgi:general secretion pathway protein E
LIDMGVEPFLISSTLNAVLAQRLVRRLCPHCRSAFQPAPAVLSAFGELISAASTEPFYRATGCAQCDGSGYRGRVAVLELLVMNDAIADLALKRAHAQDIAQVAAAHGMRGMLEDGLAKARAGVTTLDEILRVASDG